MPEATDTLVAESPGIGLYSESLLHAALKRHYARPGDRLEVSVEGRVVDVVRPDEYVEVQTRNLRSIVGKVAALSSRLPVRIVHPVAVETVIERLDPGTGEVTGRRRSPAKRDLFTVFDELVHAYGLVGMRDVSLDVVLVRLVERRVRDGTGSWRRKGDRIAERDLAGIVETRTFGRVSDWMDLFPAGLEWPCDAAGLGLALGIAPERARKMLYVLCKAGLLHETGRRGRRKLYERFA